VTLARCCQMQLAAQCCHVKEYLCSPVKRGVVSFRADTIDNRFRAYIKNIEIVDSRFPSLDAKEEDADRLDSDGATGGPSSWIFNTHPLRCIRLRES